MIKLANNRAGRDNRPPAPPLKSDGSHYSYVYYPSSLVYAIYTDELTDIISDFIKGYESASEKDQLSMRQEYLKNTALNIRLNILAKVEDEIKNDLIDLEDWEILELRYHNDLSRYPRNWDDEKPHGIWKARPPLVLVDADYSPYTDVSPVVSGFSANIENAPNILWLNSSTELTFLGTLNRLKQLRFGKPTLTVKHRKR